MKRLLLTFIFIVTYFCSYSQSDSIGCVQCDSIVLKIEDLKNELWLQNYKHDLANRYKIYPTEHAHILINLDTQTGRLELVQWSLKEKNEITVMLNREDLSIYDDINSFELYPTSNMYQFILLDKATGRSWHVQWGTESSERWIRRIY